MGCEKIIYKIEFPNDPFNIKEKVLICKHIGDMP